MPDIVTLQGFRDDGNAVVRIWTLDDEQAAAVARLLGEPTSQQVYTVEQLEQAHREIGPVPTVYRDGV